MEKTQAMSIRIRNVARVYIFVTPPQVYSRTGVLEVVIRAMRKKGGKKDDTNKKRGCQIIPI